MGLRVGSRKFTTSTVASLFSGIAIVWLTLIVAIGYLNIKEGDIKSNNPESGSVRVNANGQTSSNFSGIAIFAKLSNIDLLKFTYIVHFTTFASGQFLDSTDPLLRNFPAVPITIKFGANARQYSAKQEMPPQDITFTITSGDLQNYPFDSFQDSFMVTAFATNNSQPIPVAVSLIAGIQSFSFDNQVIDKGNTAFPAILVEMSIFRSFTTKFFSLFVIITMWILSLLILILASSVWLRGRKVEPPTIAFVTGMLFALPAVRNVQPGVPTIGCTSDVIGFFWNMMLVAASACLLLVNYIQKYKNEKKRESIVDQRLTSSPFTIGRPDKST